MKIRVSTIELDDDVLKSIRRLKGQNGKALREEAHEWILAVIQEQARNIVMIYPPNMRAVGGSGGALPDSVLNNVV